MLSPSFHSVAPRQALSIAAPRSQSPGLNRLSVLLSIGLMTTVLGCAAPEREDPYASFPAEQLPLAGEVAGHPQPSPSFEGPLTLERALEVASRSNPRLAAGSFDVSALDSLLDATRAGLKPRVDLSTSYDHQLNDQRLTPPHTNFAPGAFTDDAIGANLVVSFPLFTGGRLGSEVDIATLAREAASHHLARSREELEFNVRSVFLGILAEDEVVTSLEFSRKALERHLTQVKELIASQKAAEVDRLRTEVRLAAIDAALVKTCSVVLTRKALLASLMGVELDPDDFEVVGTLQGSGALQVQAEEAQKRALTGREDLLAARAMVESQARSVDRAGSARWPVVTLVGAYGGRLAIGGHEEPAGTSALEDEGHVGVAVTVPVYEGGQIEARVHAERARLHAAQQRLHQLELDIRLQVQTALTNLDSAAERIQVTETSIAQAKESLRIEQEKYEVGQGTLTDVLDAQAALLEAQTQHTQALADYDVATAALNLAMGA